MNIIKIEKIENKRVYDISVLDDEHYILENNVVCHNSGLQYAGDSILEISKAKARDEDNKQVGVKLKVTAVKSRLIKENKKVELLLNFDTGFDIHHGLIELALELGVISEINNISINFMDQPVKKKDLREHPENYVNQDFLDALDIAIQKEFKFGN